MTEERDNVGNTSETNCAAFGFTPEKDNKLTAEFHKSLSDVIQNVETQPLIYTPSRLHTLTNIHNSVANMEADFVSFKMELMQTVQSLQSTMTTYESETKDKLTQFDNISKLRLKIVEEENKEFLSPNGKLVDEVTSLSSTAKRLQDQINSMRKKIAA